MKIYLKKFGSTLSSRQSGLEAYNAIQPKLKSITKDEMIEVDFDGVDTFTPSWGDEFLTALVEKYTSKRVLLLNTENLSVSTSLDMINQVHNYKLTISKGE